MAELSEANRQRLIRLAVEASSPPGEDVSLWGERLVSVALAIRTAEDALASAAEHETGSLPGRVVRVTPRIMVKVRGQERPGNLAKVELDSEIGKARYRQGEVSDTLWIDLTKPGADALVAKATALVDREVTATFFRVPIANDPEGRSHRHLIDIVPTDGKPVPEPMHPAQAQPDPTEPTGEPEPTEEAESAPIEKPAAPKAPAKPAAKSRSRRNAARAPYDPGEVDDSPPAWEEDSDGQSGDVLEGWNSREEMEDAAQDLKAALFRLRTTDKGLLTVAMAFISGRGLQLPLGRKDHEIVMAHIAQLEAQATTPA